MTPAELINQLEMLNSEIARRLIAVIGTRTGERLGGLALITATDFRAITEGLPIEQIVTEYVAGLDPVSFATASGFSAVDLVAQDFEILKAAKLDELITKVNANLKLFRSTMADLMFGNISRKDLLTNLELIKKGQPSLLGLKPITDAQLNTAVVTAQSNFNRLVTVKAFENKPEQRFEYIGGVIPTSSEQCSWLMNNQDPQGYTKAEIDAGIQTPAGAINWFGRIPNYNCIHEWLPID